MIQAARSEDFWAFLEDNGYVLATRIDQDRWVGVKRLMYHWTMCTGIIGDIWGVDDRYCYADGVRAFLALADWAALDFAGEPAGWRRHSRTGRRRNDDGDAESEWIES